MTDNEAGAAELPEPVPPRTKASLLTTEGARAVLVAAFDAPHPYRAIADGVWRLKLADDNDRWAITHDAALVILAANASSPQATSIRPDTGRNTLCQVLYFLSVDGPDVLTPDNALDEETLQYCVANNGLWRRASHRSRVAFMSRVRIFRFGFPELFPPKAPRGDTGAPQLAPIEDWPAVTAQKRTHEAWIGHQSVETLTVVAGGAGGRARWPIFRQDRPSSTMGRLRG